ncbi:MAG: fasciclin domain-containing protein [Alphaproteobacteria bacterium]|nr:fasciclin domain-containing protein [Alphaproteobacteria bacterium]MBU2341857.1 fasciclin domain-containing protein [Alphaproteobacteria bacterium]
MNKFAIALASAASLAIVACAEEPADTTAMDDAAMADQMANDDAAMVGETDNIVQVAQGNPEFSTLVSAVTTAELGETLSGEGPYTVFAPTNAAFDKIPQATRDELMSEAGREDLTGILTYHVVEGETMAAALTAAIEAAGTKGYELTTVNGATLTATLVDGNVVLTDAAGNTSTVTGTDVDASNGVIHSIDTVLMPE